MLSRTALSTRRVRNIMLTHVLSAGGLCASCSRATQPQCCATRNHALCSRKEAEARGGSTLARKISACFIIILCTYVHVSGPVCRVSMCVVYECVRVPLCAYFGCQANLSISVKTRSSAQIKDEKNTSQREIIDTHSAMPFVRCGGGCCGRTL